MMDIKKAFLLIVCCLQIGFAQAKDTSPLAGVIAQKEGEIYLYATSSVIKTRQKIGLLDPKGNYTCCLLVNKKLATEADIPLSDYAGTPVYVYAVELRGKAIKQFQDKRVFGVALRQEAQIVESKDSAYTIQYAGEKTLLTVCTSQEGMHVITKKHGNERVLEHLYYYFGYDVEPTCNSLLPPNL